MKPGDLVEFYPHGIKLDANGEGEPKYGILLYKADWGDWAILRGDIIIHYPLATFKLLDF